MADDWIKFRKKLLRDGRPLSIARKCNASALQVIGALVTLWSIADDCACEDGLLPGYTPDDLDCAIGLPGFTRAMPQDWCEIKDESVYLPMYQQHNGATAKHRASTQKRVSKHRKCNAPALPEKRREEKSKEVDTNVSTCPDVPSVPKSERLTSYQFPTIGGMWVMPVSIHEKYESSFAGKFDLIGEYRKMYLWLRDHKDRRPKASTGMKQFITRWLNKSYDRAPTVAQASQDNLVDDPEAVLNERGELVLPLEVKLRREQEAMEATK